MRYCVDRRARQGNQAAFSRLSLSFSASTLIRHYTMEATSQSLPRVFRTGSSTDGRSVSPALSALLPSSSWNGLLTTDSVSAAAAIYPSRFLFEPKMSNDSSRRRRRLFPLSFQHFSRPHRLNLRERAGSVFVLRRPIDALLRTYVGSQVCVPPSDFQFVTVVASGDLLSNRSLRASPAPGGPPLPSRPGSNCNFNFCLRRPKRGGNENEGGEIVICPAELTTLHSSVSLRPLSPLSQCSSSLSLLSASRASESVEWGRGGGRGEWEGRARARERG